jgi:hypothetical protein
MMDMFSFSFDAIISNPDFGCKSVFLADKEKAEKFLDQHLSDSDFHPIFGWRVCGFDSVAAAEEFCKQQGWRVRR